MEGGGSSCGFGHSYALTIGNHFFFFPFNFSKSNVICFEPLDTKRKIQCAESFYSHPRGLKRPRTPERSPVVFSPLISIGSLTEPPRAGISNSRVAWAQDTSQSYHPSRFTMTSGCCQARTLSLLWSRASAPSPSSPNLFPLPASTMSSLAPHSAPLSLWGKLPLPHSVPQFTEAPLDLTFGWGDTSTSWGEGEKDPVMMMMSANFFNT